MRGYDRHMSRDEPVLEASLGNDSPPAELGPGDRLGGYEVERLVARGGMGVVYRAWDRGLDRAVALKVIAPAAAADPAFRLRFEREWRLAASLEHPHVVPVHQAGEERGRLFLVMRFVEGESLEARLAQGPLHPPAAVEIVAHIALALDAAHARGLVHRDVKPGNILLDASSGWSYLADFGLAIVRAADARITGSGQFMGTPAYAAPEQIRGGEASARSDIYSLGAVLHHCLTGQVPFPAAHPLDALSAHLSQPPPQPSMFDAGLPEAFDTVIGRAMAKEPQARIETATALAGAARAALAEHGSWPAPPQQFGPLVGRDTDVATVSSLLSRPDVRLVTITGSGGIGKTRLAVELARRSGETYEVAFIELASLRDAGLVVPTVAAALGVGDRDAAGLQERLSRKLAGRRALVVLDNFEQLLAAAADVAELSAAVPKLRILVTSRSRLRVAAEHEYALGPLTQVDAVHLFNERAHVGPQQRDGDAVEAVCRRLDGLPLAIELAAARARILSPRAMLERLDDQLALLAGGPRDLPDRQRALRATIRWSEELLSASGRVLLARLSVFAGAFTLEAAEQVCGAGAGVLDDLEELVEHGLVGAADGNEQRFVLAQAVREYAAERLSAEDRDRQHARHARWMLSEAERWDGDATVGILRLSEVIPDLRAASAWLHDRGSPEEELHLLVCGGRSWYSAGLAGAAVDRLRAALARDAAGTPIALRVRAMSHAAQHLLFTGDLMGAGELAEAAIRCAPADDLSALHARTVAAIVALESSHDAEARGELAAGLAAAHEARDAHRVATCAYYLAEAAELADDQATAEAKYAAALDLDVGLADLAGQAVDLCGLARVALDRGRVDHATEQLDRALCLSREAKNVDGTVTALEGLAAVAAARGDVAAARGLTCEADRERLRVGLVPRRIDRRVRERVQRMLGGGEP